MKTESNKTTMGPDRFVNGDSPETKTLRFSPVRPRPIGDSFPWRNKTYEKEYRKRNKEKISARQKIYQPFYRAHLKELRKQQPWLRTNRWIINRCSCQNSKYYKKGIKNYLTKEDLKFLWFRDKAFLLEVPSIDRIDNKGNYCLSNCRYIEQLANTLKGAS